MTEGRCDGNLEKKHLSLNLKRIYLLLLALNVVFLGVGVFEWIAYFNTTKNLADVALSVLVGTALFLLYSSVLLLSLDRLSPKNSSKDLCLRFMIPLLVIFTVFIGQLLQNMSMLWLLGTSLLMATSGIMTLEILLRWRKLE